MGSFIVNERQLINLKKKKINKYSLVQICIQSNANRAQCTQTLASFTTVIRNVSKLMQCDPAAMSECNARATHDMGIECNMD